MISLCDLGKLGLYLLALVPDERYRRQWPLLKLHVRLTGFLNVRWIRAIETERNNASHQPAGGQLEITTYFIVITTTLLFSYSLFANARR